MAADGGDISDVKITKICSIDRMAIGLYALTLSQIKPENHHYYLVLTGKIRGGGEKATVGMYPKEIPEITDDLVIDDQIIETNCPKTLLKGRPNNIGNIFPIDAGSEARGVLREIRNRTKPDDLLDNALINFQIMFNTMNGSRGILGEFREGIKNDIKRSPLSLLMQWIVFLSVYDKCGCFTENASVVKYANNFRRAKDNKEITDADFRIYDIFNEITDLLLNDKSIRTGSDMINYLMSKTFGDYGTIYTYLKNNGIKDGELTRVMKDIKPFLIRDIAHDQHDTLDKVELLGGRKINKFIRPQIKKGKDTVKKDDYRAAKTTIFENTTKDKRRKRLSESRRQQIEPVDEQSVISTTSTAQTVVPEDSTGLVKASFIVSEPVHEDSTGLVKASFIVTEPVDEQSVISTASTAKTAVHEDSTGLVKSSSIVSEDGNFKAYMDEIYGQISFLDRLNEIPEQSKDYYWTLDMLKTNLLSSYLVVSGATRIIVRQLQDNKRERQRLLHYIRVGYANSNVERDEERVEGAALEGAEGRGTGRKNTRRIRLSKRKSKKKSNKSKKKARKSKKKARKSKKKTRKD